MTMFSTHGLRASLSGRGHWALALPSWVSLSLIGGLSVLVAWLGLVQPYSLMALEIFPRLSIDRLTRADPVAQARFVLTLAVLSGLYYLAWRLCRSAGRAPGSRRLVWMALVGSLLALNAVMVWLYPIGAADLFDNIARGRITAQYGGNPFYETPRAFPRDQFRYYVGWPDATTAYGPLWELLAAGASRLADDDRLANVLAFKALGLAFYAGSAGLIAALLHKRAPERALQGVCLFAWNPVVIYETAGNGHNDIAVAFFILLALWALERKAFTTAVLALVGGVLIKYIPLLLLPIALVYGLRGLPAWRLRLRFLISSFVAAAALAALTLAPFWRGGDLLALERRSTLFTTSLPALVQVQLQPLLGLEASQLAVSMVAACLTAVIVLRQAWRVWRRPDWLAPARAAAHVLLFYLLFASLWFQPWYTVWALAVAAILPEGAVGRTVVLMSYAAAWKTIIFDFFVNRGDFLPPAAWRETWLGPTTLGLVWLYVAYRIWRRGWTERVRPAARAPVAVLVPDES